MTITADGTGFDDVPNPGSPDAVARGCTCAVLDNNRGQRPPWPPSGWWVTEGCPLHHTWSFRPRVIIP